MKKIVLLTAALVVSVSGVSAQTLSYDLMSTQSTINVGSTSTDPTSLHYAYDGYIFFSPSSGGAANDVLSLPSFVTLGTFISSSFNSSYSAASGSPTLASDVGSTLNAANRYGSNNYSSITVTNGVATVYSGHTGDDYKNNNASTSSSSPTTLGVIQLNSGTPSSFNVGFLLDNDGWTGGQFSQNISLTLENSSGVAIGSALTLESSEATNYTPADDFFYATVSNASAGDFLVLQGYNLGPVTNGYNTDLEVGGIVFSAAATPEPSTWALLGVSLIGGIAFLAKRRSAAFKA